MKDKRVAGMPTERKPLHWGLFGLQAPPQQLQLTLKYNNKLKFNY